MREDSFDGIGAATTTRIGSTSDAVAPFALENEAKLGNVASLLESISDLDYALQNEPASTAPIGAHVRHVLDFYTCLIRGISRSVVDYEQRDRDPGIEVDRRAALARINALRSELLSLAKSDDRSLEVVLVDFRGTERRATTSLVRELEAALSHSVHHFAIIAVLLRIRGIAPASGFGVAPSTLRHLKRHGE